MEARLAALEDSEAHSRENMVCDAERAALRIDINELKARLEAQWSRLRDLRRTTPLQFSFSVGTPEPVS